MTHRRRYRPLDDLARANRHMTSRRQAQRVRHAFRACRNLAPRAALERVEAVCLWAGCVAGMAAVTLAVLAVEAVR